MLVQAAVAFAGGLLSLLSPCSAMLLPAFFAYAFPSPARLALRTVVFYLGMLTLLVPAGIGAGALGGVLLAERGPLSLLAGLLLIAIGALQLARGGFELGPSTSWHPMSAERAASTYVLGMGYGLGGFCAGPILGAILTLAANSGGAIPGALLLAVYAAGMAAPLFVLALVWDRLGGTWRGRLRGRAIRLGPLERHVSTLISSVLFIAIGVGLIVFQGANPFAALYPGAAADALTSGLETSLQSLADSSPLVLLGATGGLLAVLGFLVSRLGRVPREPER